MWDTVFVIDGSEVLAPRPLPPFTVGGKVMLIGTDKFSDERLPVGFKIDNVIFDIYSQTPKQYVYLKDVR